MIYLKIVSLLQINIKVESLEARITSLTAQIQDLSATNADLTNQLDSIKQPSGGNVISEPVSAAPEQPVPMPPEPVHTTVAPANEFFGSVMGTSNQAANQSNNPLASFFDSPSLGGGADSGLQACQVYSMKMPSE